MVRDLNDASVLRLIQIALTEDIGTGDITAESIFDIDAIASASLLAKESGIICGLKIAELTFRNFTIDMNWRTFCNDGDYVEKGSVIAQIEAPSRVLLSGERTALNFLQRMSGVATQANRYVRAIEGTGCRVLDTRKTIPGWRLLDKYAAKIGGATNHRYGLYDMVMIKDNHITAAGSIEKAIEIVIKETSNYPLPIEVETATLGDVARVLQVGGITRIMFDNFSVANVREAVKMVEGRFETEASGGINLQTIRDYAETGVDFVSVGAITHSAPALDISMNIIVSRQFY
ncbi:MAG TPA: carboxylating nicotinate-nucleotide diphosphorylase [Candidatus Kapabacteria bacterium]|jgi:nicotinate-nucleotide pyrophosphorylase (carboxylating)|nr:carboxylating nicotinate-nucleotide diphosphorylase [Ignavibacteria bacterium]MBN8572305.1 carboxylating nicotinate-nucleotide diphosphorylase [Candidatus Kapabacteria bacterium]HRE58725.1 carboxylating nicotinate-nucleotide diphosphorylase [Candidatus Kapabacteria bacterium]HRK59524.1 carboxylating nicotinate-nucleotide diphosphorylase [Candidatus Kapabacteria bacterium]